MGREGRLSSRLCQTSGPPSLTNKVLDGNAAEKKLLPLSRFPKQLIRNFFNLTNARHLAF